MIDFPTHTNTSSGCLMPQAAFGVAAAGLAFCAGLGGTMTGSGSPIGLFRDAGTSSGTPVQVISRQGLSGVRLIRKKTGLTLEETARLLGVTRRTLHHWDNGRPISRSNEESIEGALSFVELLGSLPVQTMRGVLLSPVGRGMAVLDLVQLDQKNAYSAARLALTRPHGDTVPDEGTRRSQAPIDAVTLLGALDVPSPALSETRRVAKTVRNRAV